MKTTLTIEESARLIELGVPESISTFQYCKAFDNPNEQYPTIFRLEDLLRILPKKITDRKRIYELEIWVDHYSDNWCIEYTHDIDVNDFEDSFVSAEELIDAVYQEIVTLTEYKNAGDITNL